MKKKKVYISLPRNRHYFDDVEARCVFASGVLEKYGFEAVSPLEVANDQEDDFEEYIWKCIKALFKCDAVIFLKGWSHAGECKFEYEAARMCGKIMFHSMKEVEKYYIEQCKEQLYEIQNKNVSPS